MQASNDSAEFGRNAGGVVQIAIRSGTNDFHGSAYEFIRNDDARHDRRSVRENVAKSGMNMPVVLATGLGTMIHPDVCGGIGACERQACCFREQV